MSQLKSLKRDIEEYPLPPFLSSHTIDLLTQLCFRKDDLEVPAVDCLFVFGSTVSLDLLAGKIRLLVQKQASQTLILTGGIVTYDGAIPHPLPQSQMLYERIQPFLPPNSTVLCEESSQNTLENVQFGLKTFQPSSVCFVTKNFHCGRSYCTLRRHLPHAFLFQCSYAPDFQPENWHQHPLGRARIWGEFLRIKAYGARGDIAIHECAPLLADIEKSLN